MRSFDESADLGWAIKDCETIDLNETNRLAKMLVRTDNKYVLNFEQFRSLTEDVSHLYSALEINEIKEFSYLSCYYDDQFGCYFEHHQARRKRFKVRTREYVDSGLKFFEVKLKGLRGITHKHRVNCEKILMPQVQGDFLELLSGLYAERYKKPMGFALRPALLVGYKRCTLVFKEGGERVTIDFGLTFKGVNPDSEPVHLNKDFIIVETKSKDGKGTVDLALKRMRIRKARKCSKYCIGVNLTGAVQKNNSFLHTIKHARKNVVEYA